MRATKILLISLGLMSLLGCEKSDFLNKKPSTNIIQPTTLDDFRKLLDNTEALNLTGGLASLSSDEYVASSSVWNSASATERNAYIWAREIYQGDVEIRDWNNLYGSVFIANNVLDGISRSDSANTQQGNFIKGWALFSRAFAFYDLARAFCKAYDDGTASTDLGIPLRLSPNINRIEQRSTLLQSYERIFADLGLASQLLPSERPTMNLNRPSKLAVYALYARIYLDMRKYPLAGLYADSCLSLYDKLMDYNSLDTTASVPFSFDNDELIYNTSQVPTYTSFTPTSEYSAVDVNPSLIELYDYGDLRKPLYYFKSSTEGYKRKQGYNGWIGFFPFTGLATDEVYLIKAECAARSGEVNDAMEWLNKLLTNRYNNTVPYHPVEATSPQEALQKILLERRKELSWRGLRWYDIKRLNKGGANIILTRTLNNETHTLMPNSSRYVFPIPDDEIALSGIAQNQRD